MKNSLQAAVIGLGGFAHAHHESLRVLEEEGEVQLVATCDSRLENVDAPTLTELEARGVRVYADYLAMLDAHAGELDFVCVPTPIPLHAPMHRACVARGLAVYLEKPPTLDPRELESMIAVEHNARFQTQVGFNFIVEAPRQHLKSRILSGEFGNLRLAEFSGFWPRAISYFRRANWAGRLRDDAGHLVLDSCVGNALAHYMHNLLFWCGDKNTLSWGEIEEVEAELYRAHAIESFDTVFARGKCGGAEIRVAATHAGFGRAWQREAFECEHARVVYQRGEGFEIEWNDGRRETGATDTDSTGQFLTRNLRHFIHYLNGTTARPLTTLADSRPFVHLNALLFIAAQSITPVAEAHLLHQSDARGDDFILINTIEEHLCSFVRDGVLPSEKEVPWSRSGGRALRNQLPQLERTVEIMRAQSRLST